MTYPPPRQHHKNRQIAGIAVVVVVLLGGGTGLFFALRDDGTAAPTSAPTSTSSTPTGDPEEIATRFGAIVQDQLHRGVTVLAEFDDVSCANDLRTAREKDYKIATRPKARATIAVADVRTKGDSGTFTLTYANLKKPDRDVLNADLVVEDGAWRVCNVFAPKVTTNPST
jgi:hypothetical protein